MATELRRSSTGGRFVAASLLFSAALLAPVSASAELSITPTPNATTLANAFVRAGITVLNVTRESGTVDKASYAPFTGTFLLPVTFSTGSFVSGPLGMASGALLTSGEVTLAAPPNISLPGPTEEGASGIHRADDEISSDFFCDLGGLHPDDLHPHLYTQHDDAAVAGVGIVGAVTVSGLPQAQDHALVVEGLRDFLAG